MSKTISLKELPNTFISSGMTLSELCDYLKVSEELVREWERIFNLFPESGEKKVYSQERIKDFIKVKDSLGRGMSLYEIKRKIFRIEPEGEVKTEAPVNPFETKYNTLEFKPEDFQSLSASGEELVKPFLTQLNRANEKIGELILEKARLVEETAVEKAGLMSEIKTLQAKNLEFLSERENLLSIVKQKEEQIKESRQQETTLAEALKQSHELLKQKEDELLDIQDTIEAYERDLNEKDVIIYRQSLEIDRLIEKQNKKWWHTLRDIFF